MADDKARQNQEREDRITRRNDAKKKAQETKDAGDTGRGTKRKAKGGRRGGQRKREKITQAENREELDTNDQASLAAARERLVEADDYEGKSRILSRYDMVCGWFDRFAETELILRVPSLGPDQSHEQWLQELEREVVLNKPTHWQQAHQKQRQQSLLLQWIEARLRLPELERGSSNLNEALQLFDCYENWSKAIATMHILVPIWSPTFESIIHYMRMIKRAVTSWKGRYWEAPTRRESWLLLWMAEIRAILLKGSSEPADVERINNMFNPLKNELKWFARDDNFAFQPPLPGPDETTQQYWDRLNALIEIQRNLAWNATERAEGSWTTAGGAFARYFFDHAEYQEARSSFKHVAQWARFLRDNDPRTYAHAPLAQSTEEPKAYVAKLEGIVAPLRTTWWNSANNAEKRKYIEQCWAEPRAILANAIPESPRKVHIMRSFDLRKRWADSLFPCGDHITDPPKHSIDQTAGDYLKQLDNTLDGFRQARWLRLNAIGKRIYISRRWSELATDLYMAEQRPDEATVSVMQRHYAWANQLAASGMYLEKPPMFYADREIDEYLAGVATLINVKKTEFYAAWMEAADSVMKPAGYEHLLLQKRMLCLTSDHSDLGHDPPVQCRCESENASDRAWRLAWKVINRQMASRSASHETEMRLTVFEDMAEEDRELYNELIWPPLWRSTVNHIDYLALLNQIMIEARGRFLTMAWQTSIERAKAEGDADGAQTLQRRMKEAQMLYKDYRRRWRPELDEAPPAVDIDNTQARVEQVGFKGARGGIGGRWQYKGELGAGSFGFASIWVKLDANELPIDRTVIKQIELAPRAGANDNPTVDNWDHRFHWLGEPKDRMPRDYGLVKPLNDLPGSENVIKVDGYAIYDIQRTFQIYLEYCEHGDLHDLIHKYRQHRRDAPNRNDRIPVRMLWSVFEALASAACLMNHGQLPAGPPAPAIARWQALIHRDIKSSNIFLAKADNTKWSGVPIPKLADFGMGIVQSNPDADVPGTLTPGFGAPEQYDYLKQVPPRPDLDGTGVSHKSDIWSLAKTMLNLINLQYESDPGYVNGKYSESWEPNKLIVQDALDFYEEYVEWVALRELLEWCLQKYPEKRPNGMELMEKIREEVNKLCGDPPTAMKMAPVAHLGEELRLYKDDLYSRWAPALPA